MRRSLSLFPIGSFALVLLLTGTPLHAETRIFRYNGPVGELVPKLIDELGDAGFRFRVRNIYNEKNDGKYGFVFEMKPELTICELLFESRGKVTLVRLFTQNTADRIRFEQFFTKKMKMVAVGVPRTKELKSDPSWPLPGR